ncbi:YcaO-related McrA-glycine thioamidation protein [Methanocaldococcus indicus]|uniref:YcaO-related McrA-glycine thioamidation protein n=1 Tax=Methanocaldococcus indicus TaxID=213231 RepID=UPI003C6D7F0F
MYREKSSEETFRDIQEALKKINLISIEKVDLDKVNIPVYFTKRKKGNEILLSYGKGYRDIDAKVSACMEAIERASAEYDKKLVVKDVDNPINLDDLILPPYADKNVKEWVRTYDIINNEYVDVPADAVFHPNSKKLFRGNTNGLAAGNSLEEALLHGILEVVERDSWSIADLSKKVPIEINLDSIENEIILDLLERFKKANVKITIKYIATLDIPTFIAISDDKNPLLMCMGAGCHLNKEIAIIRALSELAQSRASQIQNLRNDAKFRYKFFKNVSYERAKKIYRKWFESEKIVDLDDIPDYSSKNIKKDLEFIKEHLYSKGFDKIIYANLTKFGVPAVRVIIPKMEIYSVDKDRLSKRAYDKIKDLYNI